MPEPLDDIRAEARRVLQAAEGERVPVRAIGGVAICEHASRPLPAALLREYEDIDLITARRAGAKLTTLLTRLGYEPNARFNATHGDRRLVFLDRPHGRRLDVFVGGFEMCHVIPLADRLAVDRYTIPLAELLLTKLQIVQVNEKDLKDVYALLLEHDVGEGDDDVINAAVVARLLSADWGLWRSCRGTLQVARDRLPGSGLPADDRELIAERIDRLWARVDAEPKSLRWRGRARVGDRVRWYEQPDEIVHQET